MRCNIFLCDKCGCVSDNLEIIDIKFKNSNMDYHVSLCNNCFKDFCKLKEEYTKAQEELKTANQFQIAKHILGEK